MAIDDPTLALGADRARARELGDDNAELCWLATVDEDGWPQVRTLVLRIPLFSTRHSTSRCRMKSPTWNGRSISTASDPNKLASVSLPASATAKPPIPKPASNPATL